MSPQKLPDGLRIDVTVYLTNGEMRAAVALRNFSIIPPISITDHIDVNSLLSAAGLGDNPDFAGWRVMTAAEIKEYLEDNA